MVKILNEGVMIKPDDLSSSLSGSSGSFEGSPKSLESQEMYKAGVLLSDNITVMLCLCSYFVKEKGFTITIHV